MIKKISFILMSLIISIELFGLDWNVEQKNNEYTFEIKFTDEEINSFIKNGKQIEISDGFLRSVVNDAMLISYTLVLENEVGDLSLNYISKDIKNYSLNYNLQKVSDDSTADDKLHIRNMDFINISSIPQGGSVLQIFPIIPLSKNEIKVLKSAKFTLNSYSKSITQFDGKRKIRSLKKSQSLREELPNKYINLFVDEPGLYKITGKELEKAGADLSDIDVRYLKLYRWGEEIPIRVQTNSLDSKEMLKEDAIYFLIDSLSNPYGDYKYNPFTSYEAIHIEWETDKVGKRLVERSGAVIGEPDMFPADYNSASQYTYHFERNELWDELGHMETDVDELTYISEHWFMLPAIKVKKTGYFNFNIEHVAKTPNTIEFAIRLQGNSYGGAGEHIVDIAINGYSIIDDMTWHDQYPKVIKIKDTEFYQSYLNEGENTLRIELSGEDSDVNEVFLDWFELVYEKELIATDDVIEFSAPKGYKKGNYLFELKEYSTLKDVMVIKDGLWWMRDLTVFKDNNSNKYSIIFQDSIITGDENYYAVSGDGIKSIDSLQYIDFDEEELGYTHNEGDYIIISNLEYFEELERFVELKQRKGFIPVVYNINQIYDEYATSNMTPFAIKNFLRDVYYDWSIQPEYVLLVGDVTTNGKIEEYKNWYIPTIFFQAKTTKGAVLTDIWYADIDDDYFQEYSIGRWPIRNKEHLNNMIDKTIAFDEVTNISDWLNNAVMIAGFESFFKGQTEDVINDLIPEFMSVDRFYVKNSAESVLFEVQPNDIANAFNEGKVLLNFFGHGGGAVWNDGNIFLNEEAKDLTNKLMPTVVNSLTCYSTTFNTESSIGEALMRVEGGSVTFFGASGFGFVNNDYWLIQNVYQKLFEQQMDIGKSIQYGKLNYFTTNWTPYKKTMVYQFNLLGDPSLKLPIDYTPLELTLSNKMINSGDSLKFSLPQETALFGSYNVTYDSTVMYPTNTNGYYLPIDCKMPLFHNIDVVYNGSNIEHSIKIPTDIEASRGDISLFIWDDDNYRATHIPFVIASSYIGNPTFYPAQPKVGETAYIQVDIEDNDGISEAYIGFISSGTDQLILQSENNFRSQSLLNWNSTSGKSFKIVTIDNNNDTTISREFTLAPLENIDLEIRDYNIVNGMSEIEIRSNYNSEIEVEVAMTVLPDVGNTIYDTLKVVDDVINSINKVSIGILPPWGSNEIEIKIRSLTNIEETDTLNNVDTFAVENYWINENSSLEFNLEDSIFNSVKITPIEDEYKIYIKPENVNFDLSNFNANLTNSHALKIVTEDKIDLQIKLDKNNISVDTTNFISWISLDSNKFYCQKISNNSGDQYFDIDKAGYYIFAESDDNIAPKIEININGRKLLTDSYVSNNSRGTAFITDNNGVNPLNDYWKILIDDEEISQTNVSVLQGENIKELGLSFNLELEKGNHTLQIMASDIVGNETYSDRYQIKYITDAKIIDYGNYPNPFSIRTMLIYELTEQFEELEINIYTISGKKIFTINQYNSETDILINNIGYHEITWNGRDRYNNFVANGVYFYEIKGIINNSVKKTHGKIVKLR